VPAAELDLPEDYAQVLTYLTAQVRDAQRRTLVHANTEMLGLYWTIGKTILDRQGRAAWGTKVIDRLARDLQTAFPGQKGFARRNLYTMRSLADAYPDGIVQALPAQLTWTHAVTLVERLDDPAERDWYARAAAQHGWSSRVLLTQIKNRAHQRTGAAPSNFPATLPPADSELAQEITKDPYVWDFLNVDNAVSERELQKALLGRLKNFLLELGTGFALVAEQYHIDVDGDDLFLDLLFYHYRLKRFVVFELKIEKFKPEHLGQLQTYVGAIDNSVRDHASDRDTIGILLCPEKNDSLVRLALSGSATPLAVAEYVLGELRPDERAQLPSDEQLRAALSTPTPDEPRQLRFVDQDPD